MVATNRPRGFNASSKGFVTAPPVVVSPAEEDRLLDVDAPTAPGSVVAVVSEAEQVAEVSLMLDKYAETVKVHRLALVDSDDVVLEPDAVECAEGIVRSFSGEKEAGRDHLARALSVLPGSVGDEVVEPSIAAEALRECLGDRDDEARDALIRKVSDGVVLLTARELVAMRGVRMLMEENQSRTELDYAEMHNEQVWIPMVESRRCELCGQFIGERVGHANCAAGKRGLDLLRNDERQYAETLSEGLFVEGSCFVSEDSRGARTLSAVDSTVLRHHAEHPDEMRRERYREGEVNDTNPYVLCAERFTSVSGSEDKLVDMMFSGNDFVQDHIARLPKDYSFLPRLWGREMADVSSPRRAVLFSFLKKEQTSAMKRLFRGADEPKTIVTLPLPPRIRAALVEMPIARNSVEERNTLGLVAAVVEPPLTEVEIEHIIDAGGPLAAEALLAVKRTREEAERALSRYPSHAAAVFALQGKLSVEALDDMSTHGDPLVRRAAAIAPNLSDTAAERLSTDPDKDVRQALVHAGKGFAFNGGFLTGSERNLGAALTEDYLAQVPTNSRKLEYSYPTTGSMVRTLGFAGSAGRDQINVRSGGLYDRTTSQVHRRPKLAYTLVNDPDDEVAVNAFRAVGAADSRARLFTLGKVTSRRRLEVLRDSVVGSHGQRLHEDDAALVAFIASRLNGS